MDLTQLAKAIQSEEGTEGKSILIYGPPGSGKTSLAATLCQSPKIKSIKYIDLEKSTDALVGAIQRLGLSEEECAKFDILRIPDTKLEPYGIETVLKIISTQATGKPVNIDRETGRVVSAKPNVDYFTINLSELSSEDVVVIDTGTQLGASALAATCLGKGDKFKPGYDEYGLTGKWLSDILSVIQQSKGAHFAFICHSTVTEDEDGKDKYFPECGTKAFSLKVAKYFSTVAYCQVKLKKHQAGTSSTYMANALTRCRYGFELEKEKNLSLVNWL